VTGSWLGCELINYANILLPVIYTPKWITFNYIAEFTTVKKSNNENKALNKRQTNKRLPMGNPIENPAE